MASLNEMVKTLLSPASSEMLAWVSEMLIVMS
jgi:hypothetical protein